MTQTWRDIYRGKATHQIAEAVDVLETVHEIGGTEPLNFIPT